MRLQHSLPRLTCRGKPVEARVNDVRQTAHPRAMTQRKDRLIFAMDMEPNQKHAPY